MSYAPDIKVMDCTLRDGGLVNDFFFTDEFVKDLYQANIRSGVDYILRFFLFSPYCSILTGF